MRSLRSSRFSQLGILLAALLLLGIFALALRTVRSFQVASDSVMLMQEVRVHLGDAYSHLKDGMVDTRTYLSGGDERVLAARKENFAAYEREMGNVRRLMPASDLQRTRLQRLEDTVRQLLVEYDAYIELRRSGGQAALAARAANGEGRRLGEEVRTLALELQNEIPRQLERPLATVRADANRTILMLWGGLALDVVLVIAVIVRLQRDRRAREAAARVTEQARAYAESIVDTVHEPLVILTHDLRVNSANRVFYQVFNTTPAEIVGHQFAEVCGGVWAIPRLLEALGTVVPQHDVMKDFEVSQNFPGLGEKTMLLNARTLHRVGNGMTMMLVAIEDITERKRAEASLQKLNTSLRAGAAELEAANRELEAFSYSVSHDLRAPLRHIDYFATAMEKHLPPAQLDAKGQRYLTTISKSARNMGQLIDDLLAFARIGRTELRRGRVSLDEIVRETRQQLQTEINGRVIAWHVAPLPEVHGDPALLRQVFANLLSNAIKYTRPRAEARIEVTAETSAPGEVVVAVRDNGAGFDMKYADKLFGVFQRLHSNAEFEGTGVGLANVRRIIERHGGRIWADAEVDRGAKFFFSLPAASRADQP